MKINSAKSTEFVKLYSDMWKNKKYNTCSYSDIQSASLNLIIPPEHVTQLSHSVISVVMVTVINMQP